ncbi:MAG TPA: hypothetical protein VN976_15045 [Verrucomicrobiae bacterium]|nr:hypothetical protein [Verrucomicrobiae bacterium]
MPMKLALSTGVLFLLLGTIAPAYAQREEQQKEQGKPQQGEQHQQEKPAPQQRQPEKPAPQQTQQHQQAKPAPQQAQQHQQAANKPAPRPQQAYGGVYHAGVKPTEPTYGGVHPSGVPQHQGQVHSGFTQSRASSWSTDHRTWQQRGGYNGYRVPDDRFRLYFGGNHFFRISRLPLLFVGGYPRFQYDGYWVTFVDPWPEAWPPTWYETDDVYLDYTGDGYYLYDRNYPGIGIAVTISF